MKEIRRKLPYALLFSLPLSLCLVTGWQLETYDHVTPGLPGVAFFLVLALILTVLSAFLLGWKGTRKPLSGTAADSGSTDRTMPDTGRAGRSFLLTWLAIALPNLIVLLGVYPGFFVYDAQDELMQVVTRTFTTHHPLLHVLALGGTVTGLHKVTGSWNLGIFVYLFLQMLLITGLYALVVRRLSGTALPRPVRIAMILWYGIFPTIVMGSLCSAKDGLFTAFTTLFLLDLTEKEHRRSRIPELLLCCTGMMLLRNNACYALAVFAFLLLAGEGIRLIRRKHSDKETSVKAQDTGDRAGNPTTSMGVNDTRVRKFFNLIIISIVIISTVIYMLTNALLIHLTHASTGEHQDTISVAIQTIARAYCYHPEVFSDEDREILLSFLSEEGLERYELRNSDFVKSTFNNERYEMEGSRFWSLWFRILKRCPMTCLNGWLLLSYSLWYPLAVNNVYEGHAVFTFTYTESSYFGYETEQPGERQSLIPPIDAFYRWLSLDATIQKIPLLSLLFAPGFYFWLYLLIALRLLSQKRSRDLLPLLMLLLLWLTYLIGPVILIRYCLPLWTILPIVLVRILPEHS